MSRDDGGEQQHVVVVGGGFAGLGCVKRLARDDSVSVTLVDQHNYHQFQPLLYQVATSQLASSDIAFSLRKLFRNHQNVDVKLGEVVELDPAAHAVTLAGGERFAGDALVVAAGSRPNFFRTPGAEEHALPLYSLDDATRLRSRILEVFEAADRDPTLLDQGALTFVVVGGGPTGVELAGALADLIAETMTVEYHHLAVSAAQIHLVDLGHTLLGPFSDSAHDYAAKILRPQGRPDAPGRRGHRDRPWARLARRRVHDPHAAAWCGAEGYRGPRSPRRATSRAGAAGGSRSGRT